MSKFTIVFVVLVAVIAMTSAISPDEKVAIKAAAIPLLEECGEELNISKEMIMTANEGKDIDALNPCYYACFFKKIGIMNEDNMFDAAAAKEVSSKYVSGGENTEKISQITTTCSAVNDEKVSDDNGCDRAKLLLKCFIKEKYALLSA